MSNQSGREVVYRNGPLEQRLMQGDLEKDNTFERFCEFLPDQVDIVYTDPPWNPGISKWFRTHADLDDSDNSFEYFNDCLVEYLSECISRGVDHVFVEHSADDEQNRFFLDAVDRSDEFNLPKADEWEVVYGDGNDMLLMLFSEDSLITDPSGEKGVDRKSTAISGLLPSKGSWVVDPCIGQGQVSKACHRLLLNCFGVELADKRIDDTIEWVEKKGYEKRG